MNVINKVIIDEKNCSIVFKSDKSILRFFLSGNGDIYIASGIFTSDNDFYLSDDNIVSIIINAIEELKNDPEVELHQIKETNFEIFTDDIFNWKSDEFNPEGKFNTMQIKKYNKGIIISINKNMDKPENTPFGTIAFNTDRSHNRCIALKFVNLLYSILDSRKEYVNKKK